MVRAYYTIFHKSRPFWIINRLQSGAAITLRVVYTADSWGDDAYRRRATARIALYSFGEVRPGFGSQGTGYAYTGQLSQMNEIGLYYYVARWYDPVIAHFSQADTYVPESQGVQGFDRYAYSNNNPIRYSDPSGHNAWDAIGQFATGFVFEFARTTAWYSPQAQNALSVNVAESDAMLVGRIAADVVTIAVGVVEVAGGITMGTAGTAVSCAATLCVAAVVTVGAGAIAVGAGATTALAGAAGLGGNLAQITGNNGSQLNNSNSDGLFSANNIITQPHFWDRLNQYGWTEQQAYNVYQNGKQYTNQYGQNVRWDPKSGITLIIDPDDGRVITTEYNPKPMKNWERGWNTPE